MSSQLPSTATSFADLAISPAIHDALSAAGIVTPSPIQAQVVPVLLEGRDVIAQARTGSGKTLAFALPMIERLADALASPSAPAGSAGVQALVLVPTRELAIQVGDVVGPLAALRRLRTTLLYGGRSLLPESRALRSAQIVIGTPGRTLDHLRQGQLNLRNLRVLVLDEADEMLDRGFARDVESIIGFTPSTRQSALFSATLPEWVAGAARTYLRQPATVKIDAGTSTPPDIEQTIYSVPSSDKLPALMSLLDRRDDGPVIVFGRTKHGVKKLAQKLAGFGYPAAALQGNLSQNARERVMADFRSGRMPILLATNVAARGLDVAEVDLVINYELPETAEWFTHRVGRTGRMGRRGQAITLLTPEDGPTWRQFERHLGRSFPRRVWGTEGSESSDGAGTAGAEVSTEGGVGSGSGRMSGSGSGSGSALRSGSGSRSDLGSGSSARGLSRSGAGSAAMSGSGSASRSGSATGSRDRALAGRRRGGVDSDADASGSGRDGSGSGRDGFASRRDAFSARDDARSGRRDAFAGGREARPVGRDDAESGRDGAAARRDGFGSPRRGRDGRRDGSEPGRDARDGRRDAVRSRGDAAEVGRDGFEARRDGFDGRPGDGVEGGDARRRAGQSRRIAGGGPRNTRAEAGRGASAENRPELWRDGRRDAPRDASTGRRDRDDARRGGYASRDGRRDGYAGGRDASEARRDGFDGPRDGAGRGQGRSGSRSSANAGSVAMKVAARRPGRRGRKPAGRRGPRSAAA